MVNVDRIRTLTSTRAGRYAVTAAATFSVLVGLATPVVAMTEAPLAAPAAAAVAPSEQPQIVAAAPAAPAAAPVVAPTPEQLSPVGITGEQQEFTPTPEQMGNAKAIVEAGKAMGLPPRAWVIAVGTSLQESNLKNIGHLGEANDHDSQGLFQQRPSSGWGTPEQITDPSYAATAFYKGLVEVPGWESLPLTQAAQTVQVSAYPDHYAKHESQATKIIQGLYGAGPYAAIAAG